MSEEFLTADDLPLTCTLCNTYLRLVNDTTAGFYTVSPRGAQAEAVRGAHWYCSGCGTRWTAEELLDSMRERREVAVRKTVSASETEVE